MYFNPWNKIIANQDIVSVKLPFKTKPEGWRHGWIGKESAYQVWSLHSNPTTTKNQMRNKIPPMINTN
jgi:hypothetical protein